MSDRPKGLQGFASMTSEQVRSIASMGGKEAHRLRVAHRWTNKTAIETGRKGGLRSGERRKLAREAEAAAE